MQEIMIILIYNQYVIIFIIVIIIIIITESSILNTCSSFNQQIFHGPPLYARKYSRSLGYSCEKDRQGVCENSWCLIHIKASPS